MDGNPQVHSHTVVDPSTVASDPRRQGDLSSIQADKPFILLVLNIRRAGQLYAIQVAVPPGQRRFDTAHMFFHPNPYFLADADYAEVQGGWNTVYPYGPGWGASRSPPAATR